MKTKLCHQVVQKKKHKESKNNSVKFCILNVYVVATLNAVFSVQVVFLLKKCIFCVANVAFFVKRICQNNLHFPGGGEGEGAGGSVQVVAGSV